MNPTWLDNWKNADLEGLRRRSIELRDEVSLLELKLQVKKDEKEVIWYYIGKREGEPHD